MICLIFFIFFIHKLPEPPQIFALLLITCLCTSTVNFLKK